MSRSRHILCTALLALVAVSPSAHAAEFEKSKLPLDDQFTLSPSTERIEVAAGETHYENFMVTNRTRSAQTFNLTVSDVSRSSDPADAFEILHGTRNGPGSWVRLSQDDVVVPSGMTATVTYQLRIPRKMEPGDALFAITASPQPSSANSAVALQYQLSSVFVAEIAGDAPTTGRIRVQGVRGGVHISGHKQRVRVTFENTGRRIRRPTGRVRLENAGGTSLWSAEFPKRSVLPGATIEQEYRIPARSSLGRQTVVVDLEDSGTSGKVKVGAGFVIPLPVLIGVPLTLALFVVGVVYFRRRRDWEQYLDDEEDPEET